MLSLLILSLLLQRFRPGQIVSESEEEKTSIVLKMSGRSSSEKRISKEMVNLLKEPPPGCAASMKVKSIWTAEKFFTTPFFQDKSVFEWVATVEGPPASPYQVSLVVCILSIQWPIQFLLYMKPHRIKAIWHGIVYFKEICQYAISAFKSVLLQGGTFILDITFPRGSQIYPYFLKYCS